MGPEQLKPTAYGRGVRSMKMDHVLHFPAIGAVAGDHVRMRLRAADYKDVQGNRNVAVLEKAPRFTVVPVTQLEKELQDEIEKQKQNLESLRRRQQDLYEKTGRLDRKFASVDALGPDQAGEVRVAGLDQHGITDKLDMVRRQIERIRLRGMYNKIFDETAARELASAGQALSGAVEPQRGPSPVAASLLTQAAREGASARSRLFNSTLALQSQVLTAIDAALRSLDKWSTYQEIVRKAREVFEEQVKVNQGLKGPSPKIACSFCGAEMEGEGTCGRCGKSKRKEKE